MPLRCSGSPTRTDAQRLDRNNRRGDGRVRRVETGEMGGDGSGKPTITCFQDRRKVQTQQTDKGN